MMTTANSSHALLSPRFRLTMLAVGLLFFSSMHAQDVKTDSLYDSATASDADTPSALAADSTTKTTRKHKQRSYWFGIGGGWGGQGDAFDMGFTYEVARNRIVTLQISSVRTHDRARDYLFLVPVGSYPLGEDASTIEVTYGFLHKGKAGIMNFSGGLSRVKVKSGEGHGHQLGFDLIIVGSTRPTDYELTESSTVGVVLRGQLIPSLRTAGLGISSYLNINGQYTFGSVTVQLALGRFRPKVPKVRR